MKRTRVIVSDDRYTWRQRGAFCQDHLSLKIDKTSGAYINIITQCEVRESTAEIDELALIDPYITPDLSSQQREQSCTQSRQNTPSKKFFDDEKYCIAYSINHHINIL